MLTVNTAEIEYETKNADAFATISNAVTQVYGNSGYGIENQLYDKRLRRIFVHGYPPIRGTKEKIRNIAMIGAVIIMPLLALGGSGMGGKGPEYFTLCKVTIQKEQSPLKNITVVCANRQFDHYARALATILADRFEVELVLKTGL